MSPDLEPEVRKRQRDRARITAILLGLFAALIFAITMAKMSVIQ